MFGRKKAQMLECAVVFQVVVVVSVHPCIVDALPGPTGVI